MKSLIALRHVAFEDLGHLEKSFHQQGYKIKYLDIGKESLESVEKLDPEMLVILGGPISVNDELLYPFLRDEFKLIEKRLSTQKPILGICLGAQLIAKVLGSRIYPARRREIGWAPITLTGEGENSALKHFGEPSLKMFHWHGETFDLPAKSMLLASTAICTNQAFAYGPNVLGIQFHPEVIAEHLEQWYLGHAYELSQLNIDLFNMRKAGYECAPKLNQQCDLFLKDWVNYLDYTHSEKQQKSYSQN